MQNPARHMGSLLVIAFAVAAAGSLTGCGGGDKPVARVAGVGSISKAELEHWMPIEARLLYREVPTRPTPTGVVPDPPTYAACISFLRSNPEKIGERTASMGADQLRVKCARKQQELKVLTLNTLIDWDWTIGDGLAAGMKVSDAEVTQRVQSLKRVDLVGVDFNKYLKYSGQTPSDMRLRAKVQLFEVKLNQRLRAITNRLPKGLTEGQQRAALAKANVNQSSLSPQQWAAKTSCRPGYVTSACKQYKGTLAPGVPN